LLIFGVRELPHCELLNAHVSILGERGRGYTWPLGSHVTTEMKKKVCHIAGPYSPGVGLFNYNYFTIDLVTAWLLRNIGRFVNYWTFEGT